MSKFLNIFPDPQFGFQQRASSARMNLLPGLEDFSSNSVSVLIQDRGKFRSFSVASDAPIPLYWTR